jgi:hypothetical protein
MNRWFSLILGPEVVLGVFTAWIYTFCARHNSYSTQDVRSLEKLLLIVPLLVVPLAFLTIFTATERNWMWLGRVNFAATVCLSMCAYRIVSGFARAGSGAAGQDAGLILVLTIGTGLCAIANAICGSLVLRAQKPAVAEWFHAHPVGSVVLTAVSTAPILVAQIVVTVVIVGVLAVTMSAFERSA